MPRQFTRRTISAVIQGRKHRLIVVLVLAAAVAAFFLSTEPWVDPTDRFRIIMGAILAQTLVLYLVLVKMFRQQEELRSQHTAATYVHTLEGLWNSLATAAETGGLPLETRMAIYSAGKEQFELYRHVLGSDEARPPTVFKP